MTTFNDESKKVLSERSISFNNKDNFSIIFMGDTHIGQTNTGKSHNNAKGNTTGSCIEKRYKILLSSIYNKARKYKAFKNVIAIVHGGDGTHQGKDDLNTFLTDTREILKYSSTTFKNKIPLLMNIGNHEYMINSGTKSGNSLNDYHQLVGMDNDVVKLFGDYNGPQVAVIMINTGHGNKGGDLGGGINLGYALTKIIQPKIDSITKIYKDVLFIIDMHIPPSIPKVPKEVGNPLTGENTLENTGNLAFHRFVRKNHSRILGVVTHHKHGYYQKGVINMNFNGKSPIPIFLTAQGGNCDYVKSKKESGRYSYYKLNFTKPKGKAYKISTAYRYNLVNQDGNPVVKVSLKIK